MDASDENAMPISTGMTNNGFAGFIDEESDVLNNETQHLPARYETPADRPIVPDLFSTLPPVKDKLITDTSISQDETVNQCLPYLTGTDPSKSLFDFTRHGVPRLQREYHVEYLNNTLRNARYMAYDAARPWVIYWSLVGLSLLGEDVTIYAAR